MGFVMFGDFLSLHRLCWSNLYGLGKETINLENSREIPMLYSLSLIFSHDAPYSVGCIAAARGAFTRVWHFITAMI